MTGATMRPLSPMEYGIWLFDLAATTNFIVVAELSGTLSFETIEAAAGIIQARHPLLRSRIVVGKWKRVEFLSCETPIPVVKEPLPSSREEFTRTLEDHQQQRFNTEAGPLCRLIFFSGDTGVCLAMVLHHSIADGVCGAHLMDALLTAAEDIARGHSPEGTLQNALPSAEALFEKRYGGFKSLAKTLWGMSTLGASKLLLRRFHFMPFDARVPANERCQHFILKELDQSTTALLLKKARRRGTSLHAVLSAAQLQAIADEVKDKNDLRLLQLSLVDLRQRMRPAISPEAVGLFISSVESAHSVPSNGDLWDLGGDIKQAIVREMDRGTLFIQWPAMMRLVYLTRLTTRLTPKGVAGVMRQGDITRPPASIVSNIGRLDFQKTRGDFTLDKLYFLMAVSGSGYFSSSINTFDGRLFINFTYASPSIGAERAQRVADKTCYILRESVD